MSRRRFRTLAAAAVVLLVVIGTAIYATTGAYDAFIADLCRTTVHRIVPAPMAKWQLIVFERDCGATTPFNTQVSLIPAGAKFSPEKFPSFFSVEGQHDLVPLWKSATEIKIAVPRGEKIYRTEQHVSGVTVTYE